MARPTIVRLVRRILGANDPDEEDVVQTALEAWIRVRHTTPIQDDRQAMQLAAVIARNVAIDMQRQRTRARRVFSAAPTVGDDGSLLCAGPIDPERIAAARELLRAFERALGALRPLLARPLYLHDALGYELEEVAEELGVSVSAAQSRLVRGRRKVAALCWLRETPFSERWRGRASLATGGERRKGAPKGDPPEEQGR